MDQLVFKLSKRKKINERNDFAFKISKIIKRPIYQVQTMIEGWPDEMVKASYLETKSETDPLVAWWAWRKKFEQR